MKSPQFALVLSAIVFATGATMLGYIAYTISADDGKSAAPKVEKKLVDFSIQKFRGRVIPYKVALKRKFDIPLVEQWGEGLLALETDSGELLPILPTEAARFFYQDPTMLDRPMEITARVYPKTPGLHVIEVHSLHAGKVHEIYYWCEICGIKLFQLKQCDCCQGPLEVREHPVGEPYRIPKSSN